MTSAVIAFKTPENTYKYWTVNNAGHPTSMIPTLAFMVRYGRLYLHIDKSAKWTAIHPSITRSESTAAIKGFGIPNGVVAPVAVRELSELNGLGDYLYVIDASEPETVIHDGKKYDLLNSHSWNNQEIRGIYSTMSSEFGY